MINYTVAVIPLKKLVTHVFIPCNTTKRPCVFLAEKTVQGTLKNCIKMSCML